MDKNKKLTQEELIEADTYFNMASLLGKSIQAAAFQITHPEYSPMLIVDQSAPATTPAEDEDDDDIELPDAIETAAGDPIIHSNEGNIDDMKSLDNQIDQIIALYTPGLVEILRPSALFAMLHLAFSQFHFDITDANAADLSIDDKRKAAIAWILAKRVFAVRHADEAIYIISLSEIMTLPGFTPRQFQPMDKMDEEFIVESCQLFIKTPPQILGPLDSLPNGEAINWLYRVVSSKGGRLVEKSRNNRHEVVTAQRKGNSLRFTRTNKQADSTLIVEIAQADKYLNKNKTFAKTMLFTLQKMAAQNFPLEVGFPLQELVDLGMYSNTSNALRAFKEFFAQQRQILLGGSVKKYKKTIREEGGVLFYHYRIENGYVILSANENFNWGFLANYYTVFPRFAYALPLNSFNIVRYIFSLARQNKEKIKAHGKFTISLDAIRENLGLPSPEDVKNRKYKQYIIDPIEAAIEEIETALRTVPEAQEYGFTITPVGTDTSNINQWLEGYLEIGLKGDFAETFIKIASKAEADQAKWEKAKTAELAKMAAKKDAEKK